MENILLSWVANINLLEKWKKLCLLSGKIIYKRNFQVFDDLLDVWVIEDNCVKHWFNENKSLKPTVFK